MIVTLKTSGLQTLEQIQGFLDGSAALDFVAPSREAIYDFIVRQLRHFGYPQLGKVDKGRLRQYLGKVTGLSRAQLTRLIAQYRARGQMHDRRGPPARPFARRYTRADVALLAELDALHGTLSGPATRKLCERAFTVFADARYERLAGISNGHLYNLRHGQGYRRLRGPVDKTQPARQVAIGERRKPRPDGQPGYLRVDSVHQGDLDGIKGLYHLNLVDAVTQFQFVGSLERISEHFLLPLLETLIERFPFVIRGFHSDNGSEYINHQVANMLTKLHITEFTKSRARRSNDNALVESKNGSVVRKHLGYAHIPGHHAPAVNAFCADYLNPYLNFHRPCFFPTEVVDAKGQVRKHYRYQNMMTPYEKLKALPEAAASLKPGITFEQLDAHAHTISDNVAARRLNQARAELFQTINKVQRPAA